MLRLVAISDSHGMHRQLKIPDGDILLHCGDLSQGHGSPSQLADFVSWLNELPHKHKVFILGNHDGYRLSEVKAEVAKTSNVHYLHNSGVTLEGKTIYGSPYTPLFCNWNWMATRGAAIKTVWDEIPSDLDILMTHGPPFGHGDLVPPYDGNYPRAVGCLELMKRVVEVKPKLHFFGHIHCGYGATIDDECSTLFINCAVCDEAYRPVQAPVVVDVL